MYVGVRKDLHSLRGEDEVAGPTRSRVTCPGHLARQCLLDSKVDHVPQVSE